MAQDELKRLEEQNEQHKQEIQQLVQSLDEQRSLVAESELKFRVLLFNFILFFILYLILGISNSMC